MFNAGVTNVHAIIHSKLTWPHHYKEAKIKALRKQLTHGSWSSVNPPAVHVSSTHCRSTNHREEKQNHILPERSRRDSFWEVRFLSSAHSIGWTMGRGRQTESRVLSVPDCLVLHRLILNDILSLIQ